MIGSLIALGSGCFLLAVARNQRLFDRVFRRSSLSQRRLHMRLPHFGMIPSEEVWLRRQRVVLFAAGLFFVAIGATGVIVLAVR